MIVFPADFTQSVMERASGQAAVPQENATAKVLADKSNPNVSDPIIGAVNGAVAQTI
ncbi:MAG: hypothetical protein ACXV2B_07295 [Halobacteriota archaeon]